MTNTGHSSNPDNPVLKKDSDMEFPCVDIISASAGSGKTHTMAMRLAQFLLSPEIKHKHPKQILAITFTNLAAKELKERLVLTLKKLELKDQTTVEYFTPVLSAKPDAIPELAEQTLNRILKQYSDLQIKTIDSFFTRVFRSSAHDFGLYADCDITFQYRNMLNQAFEELSKKIFTDAELRNLFNRLADIVSTQKKEDNQYAWDPFNAIRKKVLKIYLSIQKQKKASLLRDESDDIRKIKEQLAKTAIELRDIIVKSGYAINNNFFKKLSPENTDFYKKIITNKLYDKIFNQNQPGDVQADLRETIVKMHAEFNELCMQYILLYSRNYHYPYVTAYQRLDQHIRRIQRNDDEIPLSDLHQYIRSQFAGSSDTSETLSALYERLGETLYHYLIDEFQDTAPIHWNNLLPLIENALSKGGSLFIVGDTKQSIYAFNNADWRILRSLMDEKDKEKGKTFDTVTHYNLHHLDTNFRSDEVIVTFIRNLFHDHIPKLYDNSQAEDKDLVLHALRMSGLQDYVQQAKPERTGKGYVEVNLFESKENFFNTLLTTVQDLIHRGIPKKEIAILTRRNNDVTEISNYLKTHGIDCISYSNLDIRRQSLTNEILALLTFLDSPVNNLAFSRFLLGDIAATISQLPLEERRAFLFENTGKTLYTAFRRKYPEIWQNYFDQLFKKTGYLTTYDLVCEIFTTMEIYKHFAGESATLTKFLETVRDFEKNSRSTLKEFLSFSQDDEEDSWNILVSPDLDAIRLMTTHKAKGLGFGYVIAVFYDNEHDRSEGPFFHSEKENAETYYINEDIFERLNDYSKFKESNDHPYRFLWQLYYERKLTETVEKLNRRYVTLTRPKHELYVFGVYTKTPKNTNQQKDEKKIGSLDWLKISPVMPYTLGSKKEKVTPSENNQLLINFAYPGSARIQENYIRHKTTTDERYRGDALHFLLSKIEYCSADIPQLLKTLAGEFPLPHDYQPTEEDYRLLENLLHHPDLNSFFQPAAERIIRNEQEFSTPEGNYRMDRLVIDPTQVTIIDYKTGHPTDEDVKKYKEQMDLYRQILTGYYPEKTIQTIIAYIDENRIQKL